MLANELSELLQSLLKIVEQIINRIPPEEISLSNDDEGKSIEKESTKNETIKSKSNHLPYMLSPKCGLRRQELITKNKIVNNKYTLRRMSSENDQYSSGKIDVSDKIPENQEIMQMPLFCLGGSFPHIDSDEESDDDSINVANDQSTHVVKYPKTIQEIPEKVLHSGICLTGTHDLSGSPIITIEAAQLATAGLNQHEIATLLLYYNTIPIKEQDVPENRSHFKLHFIANEVKHLSLLTLIDKTVQTLNQNILIDLVLVSCLFNAENHQNIKLPLCKVRCIQVHDLSKYLPSEYIPVTCNGTYYHDQHLWVDFFNTFEPLRNQCLAAGRHLVSVMSDVQCSDNQNTPSKKQLYLQQRTLSRALLEPGLQNLRRKAKAKLIHLSEIVNTFDKEKSTMNRSKNHNFQFANGMSVRLREVTSLFDEVDRASRRLELLLEQRRDRITSFARQRALENEINEMISWINVDGYTKVFYWEKHILDCENITKEDIENMQKFYINATDRLNNVQSLQEAAIQLNMLKHKFTNLQEVATVFKKRLEAMWKQFNDQIRKVTTTSGSCDGFSFDRNICKNVYNDEDDEIQSKIADSGLGTCDRCERADELPGACTCRSLVYNSNTFNKSVDLEDEFNDESLNKDLDFRISTLQPNAHLYQSNIDLSHIEHRPGIDEKAQKNLLFIMKEMIETERDYVHSLRYIIENYIDELAREDIPQALRGQRNVIFGNVEKIYDFHQQNFLPDLEFYQKNPLKVGAAFLEHEDKFYLYALYNKNKPKSDSLMSEYGTIFFKSKQIDLNDKMDLASYLLKPVQRMGKYALLLQQLKKVVYSNLDLSLPDISEDVEELEKAEEMVRFQLRHGNDLLAMDSLRDCDVNVKEQGRLLRQSEFIVWQGRNGRKTTRQVFLFEELLLFSKARRFPDSKNLDIYIYKNSVKTSDIGLTAKADLPTKFEIWFRKRKPDDTWILQGLSEETKNIWIEEISRLLWKQAKRNRDVRMAEMSSMGIGNKPCLDIRPSKNQINDRSITLSQLDKAPKLKHSFSTTLPDIKSSRRSSSIGSSFSSSSGSSSMSNMEFSTLKGFSPQKTRKCKRSSTLASQISTESGILTDISSLPEIDNPFMKLWPEP